MAKKESNKSIIVIKLFGTLINILSMFGFTYFFNKAYVAALEIVYKGNNAIDLEQVKSVSTLRNNVIYLVFGFLLFFELLNHIFYLFKNKKALLILFFIELIAGAGSIYFAMFSNLPNYESFVLLLPAVNAIINYLIVKIESK